MRIAFLGTPDFAVPSLEALVQAGHEVHVFTQPDRPKGRGYAMIPPPVKVAALRHGLSVQQFQRISTPEGVAALSELAPELLVTAAWGQILSAQVLAIAQHGCINVHGSLLPKYRGAAPIQWAVINGETVTGVTTMLTDIGLDTGAMLERVETPIGPNETAGELFDRLAVLGAKLLVETIEKIQKGTSVPVPQDPQLATHCGQLTKEDGKLDFTWSAQTLHNRIRGVNPWPGAYAQLGDTTIKIWASAQSDLDAQGALPGKCIIADAKRGLFVATGDGVLEILELQFPGSKRMNAKAALLGHPMDGARLL